MAGKQVSVTLTLTEEEINVLMRALITEQVDCEDRIKVGDDYMESELLVRYAEEALATRKKAIALWHKLEDARADAKYPLLREERMA